MQKASLKPEHPRQSCFSKPILKNQKKKENAGNAIGNYLNSGSEERNELEYYKPHKFVNLAVTSRVSHLRDTESGANFKRNFSTVNQPSGIVQSVGRLLPFKRNTQELLSLFSKKVPAPVESTSKQESEQLRKTIFDQEGTCFQNQQYQQQRIAVESTGSRSHTEITNDHDIYFEGKQLKQCGTFFIVYIRNVSCEDRFYSAFVSIRNGTVNSSRNELDCEMNSFWSSLLTASSAIQYSYCTNNVHSRKRVSD